MAIVAALAFNKILTGENTTTIISGFVGYLVGGLPKVGADSTDD
jgi:hypothetical protein